MMPALYFSFFGAPSKAGVKSRIPRVREDENEKGLDRHVKVV